MFNLDRVVEKYQRKLSLALAGSSTETDIPTMVALYRAKMSVIVEDLLLAKGFLNDNDIPAGVQGLYMNVVRYGRSKLDDKLTATVLKNDINAFISQQLVKIGPSFVIVIAQALVFAVLGVPLV